MAASGERIVSAAIKKKQLGYVGSAFVVLDLFEYLNVSRLILFQRWAKHCAFHSA